MRKRTEWDRRQAKTERDKVKEKKLWEKLRETGGRDMTQGRQEGTQEGGDRGRKTHTGGRMISGVRSWIGGSNYAGRNMGVPTQYKATQLVVALAAVAHLHRHRWCGSRLLC